MDTQELSNRELRSRLAEAERTIESLQKLGTDDRKQSEEALRIRELQESEQKYRSLFDNSVAGVAITDFSGQLFEANEAICELMGYSQEELKQLNVGQFYADPNRRKEYLETLQRHGKAKDFQLELIRKNGKPLWGSFSSAMIKWQGNDAIATAVIDLTKRKQAEANYQKLVEEMNGIVFQCESDSLSMTYVSPHAEELLGYAISEWLSDPKFWANHIHPDDREFAVGYCKQQVLKGRDHAIQYRMIAADGREVWFHDTVRIVRDPSNKITHLHGVMLDISEQKQIEQDLQETEERFRLAAQSVSDLIWMRDLSSNHLIWYGDVDGALGYEPGEFPRTLDAYRKLIHPEDYERVSMASEEVALLQGSCRTEYRIQGKDGEYRHWIDNWEPVCDKKGVPIRFVGAVQDITERKRIEKELQQKEAEIAKVSRLSTLGELTSGIAHELNQPLTAIANYVEAIKDLVQLEGRDNEDLLQILENLGNTTFRTSTIISRLRGLIQKAALHRTAMNVNELAEELIEFLASPLEHSHIQVQLELAEDLPMLVIDPIQIQQVLLNLIKNAQEAMEQTAKERRLLILRTQQVDETVELRVTDSGKGLPPEDIERLFGYFYTTTPGGLGVGLQVCRTIMEAHHGSIVAQNNLTEGATFRLIFPLGTKEANCAR